jgi:hypothetical protein
MSTEFRVLVCGGRDYGSKVVDGKLVVDIEQVDRLNKALDRALEAATLAERTFVLIHGGARGADHLSGVWASMRKDRVEERVYPADWKTHGKSAGPIRNRLMLTSGQPHVIIAFKGGKGTADMVRQGNKAGIPVKEYFE